MEKIPVFPHTILNFVYYGYTEQGSDF